MGMFDTIFVEKALPLNAAAKKAFKGTDWSQIDFQTKELEETLSTFFLKKNGYLYHEKVEGDWVEDSAEEIKRKKKAGGFYMPRRFVETSRKLEKTSITGSIDFYTSAVDKDGNEWWVEFKFNVLDGKISGDISPVEIAMRRTAEEIQKSDEEFRKRMQEIDNHPWNKTRRVLNKITFGYWKKFWSASAKGLRSIGSVFDKVGFWLFRYM